MKVAPDKPQEEVRRVVLERGKQLLVPTPRLMNSISLLHRVSLGPDKSKQEIKLLASRRELVVVGSVAVDKLGHRVGKGEGFTDLEFGLAASYGMVDQNTVVPSTVHDCQVAESLHEDMFAGHDLPVDIILTTSQMIRVANKLNKPKGILWDLLTEQKISRTPLLQTIKKIEQDKAVNLNTNETEEVLKKSSTCNRVQLGIYFSNIPKDVRASEFKQCLRDISVKFVYVKWKPYKQASIVFFELEELEKKSTGKKENSHQYTKVKEDLDKVKEFQIKKDRKGSRKSRKLRKLNEYDANTGLFISNVPKTLSKPEFVNILEKAHDSPPLMVDWVGRKGYARVFWHSSELAESMLSSLSNSLGGTDIGTDIKVEKYDPSRNIYFQMLNNNDTSIKISNTESNDEIMAGEEESLKEINDLSIKTVSHENDMNTDENST